MSSQPRNPLRRRFFRVEQRLTMDAGIMLVYVLLVYGWGLTLSPLGRDYALLGGDTASLPFLIRWLWECEVRLFGDWSLAYHLVNLALLHGSMVCLYLLVNYTLRGPAWFGVLAANLFMANPLHVESALNLSGSTDLLPCLLALGALAAYAYSADQFSVRSVLTAFILLGAAVAVSPGNAFLPLVFLLYEGLLTGSHRRSKKRIAASLIVMVGSIAWNWGWLASHSWDLTNQWGALYFTVYCLGFLPSTINAFEATPWLGWTAAAAVVAVLFLMHRKARRPAVPFAVFGGLALQLAPMARTVDPTHLIGGGQLLVPQALVMLAVAALYQRIMEHPRWRMPLIYSSFSVSIIFFSVTAVSVFIWRDVAQRVDAFRTAAAAEERTPVTVVPDFQYYRGAPLMLSESLMYDTPFGAAIDHTALMQIHMPAPIDGPWRLVSVTADGAEAVFEKRDAAAFVPYGTGAEVPQAPLVRVNGDETVVTVERPSGIEPGPVYSIASAGKESGEHPQPHTEDEHDGVEGEGLGDGAETPE